MAGGHTFTNAPLACAASLATIEVIESDGLIGRVAGRGARLGEELTALRERFPFVGDVRGRGYLWGLEFVADPATAAPPDPALDATAQAVAAAAASRLIVYPARFCADGTRGDAVLVGPPLNATDEELGELLTRLSSALTALRPLFPAALAGGHRGGRQEHPPGRGETRANQPDKPGFEGIVPDAGRRQQHSQHRWSRAREGPPQRRPPGGGSPGNGTPGRKMASWMILKRSSPAPGILAFLVLRR